MTTVLATLGLGDRLPELDAVFIKNPANVIKEPPTATNLKKYRAEVNQNVLHKMEALSPRE